MAVSPYSRPLRRFIMLFVLLASTVGIGCSEIEVSSQTTSGADLSRIKTYAWRDVAGRLPSDPRIDRATLDRDIRSEIERSLAERGFELASAGTEPDVRVAYRAFIKVKTDVSSVNEPTGFSTGWSAYPDDEGYRAVDSGGTYTTEWEQGRLDIDLLDSSGAELIWRGSARTELDFTNPPKERQRRLRLAVTRIVEQLPRR